MQVAMNIALPELDGSVEPVIFGGPTAVQDKFLPLEPELELAARRIARRVRLRHRANQDKKIAVILFNFPPNLGNAGTAMYLDVFASLYQFLTELKTAGYQVDLPDDVDVFRQQVVEGNAMQLWHRRQRRRSFVAWKSTASASPGIRKLSRIGATRPANCSTTASSSTFWARTWATCLWASSPALATNATPCAC
jgi:cobalamin biosynthesis Mg chelatase CobN